MGQLAIGGLGAAAGFAVGGPVGAKIGFGLGSIVGGLLFGNRGQDQIHEGPRLDNLKIATSRYGTPIVNLKGRFRLPGHVLWSGGIAEHVSEQTEDAGKGGGGPEVTTRTFTYTAEWACWFCLGEMDEVLRVWFDSVLMYDNRSQASSATRAASQNWRDDHMIFKPGSMTQTQNSTIADKEGVADTPHFLGLCYMVFRSIPLADFGNRIPNVTAEIASKVSESNYVGAGEGGQTGAVWTLPNMTYTPGRLPGNLTDFTYGFDWSPDKSLVAVCGGPSPRVNTFNTSNWTKRTDPTTVPEGTGRVCKFSPDGKLLFVGHSTSPYAKIYNVANMSIAATLNVSPGSTVNAAAFHPLQKWIAIGGHTSGVNLEIYTLPDFLSGYPLAPSPFVKPGKTVRDLAVSPDANWLGVSTSSTAGGNQFLLYDTDNLLLAPVSPPGGPFNQGCYSCAFSPDGRWAACGHVDVGSGVYFTVWEITSSNPANWVKQTISGAMPSHWVRGMAFDAISSELAVSGGTGGTGFLYRYSVGDWARVTPDPTSPPLVEGWSPGYDVGRVWPEKVSHQEIVTKICEDSGLLSTDFDVSDLIGFEDGFVWGAQSGRSAIENLAAAGLFQGINASGQIKFTRRGRDSGITIDVEELVIREADPCPITMPDEIELPRRLDVVFPQKDKLYQHGKAHQHRLAVESQITESIELRVAMDNQRAAELADILLFERWAARRFQFSTSMEYFKLDPGDVITLTKDGESFKCRLTSMVLEGVSRLHFEAVEEHLGLWESNALGIGGPADDATVDALPTTTALLLDIPLLLGNQDGPALHHTLLGQGKAWYGAGLYRSVDGGVSYQQIGTRATSGKAGTVDTVLASGITHTWDFANTVDLTLDDTDQTLESQGRLAVLNGANAVAIGAHGRWEILQFRVATLIGTGQYRLSELLRGRLGTEHNVGNHTVTDRVVFLNGGVISRLTVPVSELNLARLYKGVTVGDDPAAISGSAYTYTGANLKPYSPVQVTGSRDGSNNLTISWKRRSRIAGQMLHNPPLGEASEAYEIDIMSGSVVLNTYSSTSESYTYTAAQQTADGLTPGNPVTVEIYQLSETVGRGYEVEATI